MVSAEQAVLTQKVLIEREAEAAKKRYGELVVNFARSNSSYARTLRLYGLDFLHRTSKPVGVDSSDNCLLQLLEKVLELDDVAINCHRKAFDELSVGREIRFGEKSLAVFRGRTDSYLKIFNEGCSLLVDFQLLVSKKKRVSACLLEDGLVVFRKRVRLFFPDLKRIFFDVFEGTAVMSGKVAEVSEEELRGEEAL